MLKPLLAACLICFTLLPAPANSADGGTAFVAVALHDVVDHARELSDDAMTTGDLIAFFEWLRGNGWTAISVDDIARAASGAKPLPQRAILITFDDGYRSLYTRVYPLLLAYRIPVVSALVGAWMDAPMDASVQYDDQTVPRSKFISWAEAREMQASGLVEFGAHSHSLHRGVTGNPQGNLMPAAVTLEYRPDAGYEDVASQQRRVETDARRIHSLLTRELGRPPRVWVWPYGRYSGISIDAVRAAGFSHALTLDAGPADARQPMAIPRMYPGADSPLGQTVDMVRLQRTLPAAQRLVCMDPGELWTGDEQTTKERLGQAIERLRAIGATAVVMDAAARDARGMPAEAWFNNTVLPVRADLLSRLTWQLQTRAGVEVHILLPSSLVQAGLGDTERTLELFGQLGAAVPLSGLFVDDAPGLARAVPAVPGFRGLPWETRAARDAMDVGTLPAAEQLAMRAFRAVQRFRPWISLTVLNTADTVDAVDAPGRLADLSLHRLGIREDSAAALPPVKPDAGRRSGIWLTGERPPSPGLLSATVRQHQREGGSAIGWCPDSPLADLPPARAVAPDVSAATFPVRF